MTDSVSNTDARDPAEGTPPEGDETPAVREDQEAEGDDVSGEEDLEDIMAELDAEFPGGGAQVEEAEDAGAEAGEGEAGEAPPAGEGTELAGLREELESLNDRHLRLAAEFNNYRRRVENERTALWGRAQADIVARFLDVLDDLQRVAALDLGNATVEAIMEGIDLVDRKFVRMLADAGVEVLDPQGERFDPETMEAMMRVPAESEEDDDTVAQVFQKGYALKGQLIRPARVSVMKHG